MPRHYGLPGFGHQNYLKHIQFFYINLPHYQLPPKIRSDYLSKNQLCRPPACLLPALRRPSLPKKNCPTPRNATALQKHRKSSNKSANHDAKFVPKIKHFYQLLTFNFLNSGPPPMIKHLIFGRFSLNSATASIKISMPFLYTKREVVTIT